MKLVSVNRPYVSWAVCLALFHCCVNAQRLGARPGEGGVFGEPNGFENFCSQFHATTTVSTTFTHTSTWTTSLYHTTTETSVTTDTITESVTETIIDTTTVIQPTTQTSVSTATVTEPITQTSVSTTTVTQSATSGTVPTTTIPEPVTQISTLMTTVTETITHVSISTVSALCSASRPHSSAGSHTTKPGSASTSTKTSRLPSSSVSKSASSGNLGSSGTLGASSRSSGTPASSGQSSISTKPVSSVSAPSSGSATAPRSSTNSSGSSLRLSSSVSASVPSTTAPASTSASIKSTGVGTSASTTTSFVGTTSLPRFTNSSIPLTTINSTSIHRPYPIVIVSPTTCPPTEPTGSPIAHGSETFPGTNGDIITFQEYNNSQFLINDNTSGPFLFDLSNPLALGISLPDDSSLYLYNDGTFKAFASDCELEIVGSWLGNSTNTSTVAPTTKLKPRDVSESVCEAMTAYCANNYFAAAVSGAAGSAVCNYLAPEIGGAVGGGVGFLGNVLGPEVGIPTTIGGAEVGAAVATFLSNKFGNTLCGAAFSVLQLGICKNLPNCSPTLTSTTYPAIRTDVTTSCSNNNGIGQSIVCCSGACYDGTSIFSTDGTCYNFLDLCYDLEGGPPSCASDDQVLFPGPDGQSEDAGLGYCHGGDECSWQRTTWTWKCCDCPLGFTSVNAGQCDGGPQGGIANGPPYQPCVGCAGEGQVLAQNSSGFYCVEYTYS